MSRPTFSDRLAEAKALAEKSGAMTWGSNADLARIIKVSAPTVHGYVHGTHMPSPHKVRELSRLLGVPFEWLYFGED